MVLNYTEEPYVLHDNVIKINGNTIIQYNGSNWLKIFHQNTKFCYFDSISQARYSKDENCYSIIKTINDKYRLSENDELFYSFLLEYPQIPQYIYFHQSTFNSDTAESYKLITSNGTWPHFGGLRHYNKDILFSGDDQPNYWNYPVGVKSKAYYPLLPFVNFAKNGITIFIK